MGQVPQDSSWLFFSAIYYFQLDSLPERLEVYFQCAQAILTKIVTLEISSKKLLHTEKKKKPSHLYRQHFLPHHTSIMHNKKICYILL